jgi:protein gp37
MAKGSELGGCLNCYAARTALRHAGPGKPYEGLVRMTDNGPRWTGKVALVEDSLEAPLHVKEPCRWFVDSMSDLFHEEIPDHYIDRVFATMGLAHWHTFQVLTKRADRMERYTRSFPRDPLPNVQLGVSVEDEPTARLRIPALLRAAAAVRFVSYEPALGPVDFARYLGDRRRILGDGLNPVWIDWLIVGGESGPGARPFDLAWARNAIEQCRAAGVPCFVKQLGARPISSDILDMVDNERGSFRPSKCMGQTGFNLLNLKDSKGGDMSEWPNWARVREFPTGADSSTGG